MPMRRCAAIVAVEAGEPAKVAGKVRGRVSCDARLANGGRCTRKSERGKKRCRYHGGRSTGPQTEEGKRRAALNLPRVRAAARRCAAGGVELGSYTRDMTMEPIESLDHAALIVAAFVAQG